MDASQDTHAAEHSKGKEAKGLNKGTPTKALYGVMATIPGSNCNGVFMGLFPGLWSRHAVFKHTLSRGVVGARFKGVLRHLLMKPSNSLHNHAGSGQYPNASSAVKFAQKQLRLISVS